LALFLIFAGSVFGLVYYGLQVHSNVRSAAASDSAIRERFGTGTVITDGRDINTTAEDVDVVNPESYVDKSELSFYLLHAMGIGEHKDSRG
jgi:hypothetical protein